MFSSRLQVVLIVIVCLYFVIIFSLLKRKSLNLKYSLLWLLSGVVMGILVIFPDLLIFLVELVGIQTPMYGLLVFCIAFLLMILMSLTSIVSRLNRKIRVLIEESALMEKRIREIENDRGIDKRDE